MSDRRSPMGERLRILFLCTGNSCRSQMAEGWARALKAEAIEAYSAGVEARGLNPRAVVAMAHYRRVRDEIRRFVEQLPGIMTAERPARDGRD